MTICTNSYSPVVKKAYSAHRWDLIRSFITVLSYTDATQSGLIPIAFTHHTLVLATRVGSLPEVVEDQVTGILINPKDSKELLDKMKWSLENTFTIDEITANGFDLISSKLSWSTIAESTIKVYASK
jgi:starch synthase